VHAARGYWRSFGGAAFIRNTSVLSVNAQEAGRRQVLKVAAISVALIVNFGAAYAQNMPTPKPEDAERNAFQTPTAGVMIPKLTKTRTPMPIQRAG
jgi:hypothetical protein